MPTVKAAVTREGETVAGGAGSGPLIEQVPVLNVTPLDGISGSAYNSFTTCYRNPEV